MKHTHAHKQDIEIALKKAKSHIEMILTMLEKGEYCVDIMQQNLAVIGLLKSAQMKLMENHLQTCFTQGMNSGNPKRKEEMIEEISSLIRVGSK